MTEREACERIVADGDCVGVYCVDCPLWDEWECLGLDEVTLAEMWLRLHPCEKKLVFSAEKFYADESVPPHLKAIARTLGWPDEEDGKTLEELDFPAHRDWMEER